MRLVTEREAQGQNSGLSPRLFEIRGSTNQGGGGKDSAHQIDSQGDFKHGHIRCDRTGRRNSGGVRFE
jgi:hypothetical protein